MTKLVFRNRKLILIIAIIKRTSAIWSLKNDAKEKRRKGENGKKMFEQSQEPLLFRCASTGEVVRSRIKTAEELAAPASAAIMAPIMAGELASAMATLR